MSTALKLIDDYDWRMHADHTFVSSLGQVMERARSGLIQIGLQTDERHINLGGIVHGGVMMTLIDRAIGINCRNQAEGRRMVTATLTTNFVSAVNVGDFITVSCIFNRVGKKTMFADASAKVGGRLVATGTGIWVCVG